LVTLLLLVLAWCRLWQSNLAGGASISFNRNVCFAKNH